MKQRLVITGMGAITPIGIGVENFWQNLIGGKCGIRALSHFDASLLPVRIASEIADFDSLCKLPPSVYRSSSRFMRLAYISAEEALIQAGFSKNEKNNGVGICMGTALGGIEEIANDAISFLADSKIKSSPHLMPKTIANMPTAHLSINWNLHGPGFTICTACSSGADALMTAAMLLLAKEADAMLVMAGESAILPSVISSLAQAKALSRRNDDPQKASRPFDKDRDGFVVGEGGGAIVLETEERAKARNAQILAYLDGWANTMDVYHITAPNPDGTGAAECMHLALKKAGLAPCDIGYINAHGTSTILGDIAETLAIKKVFGKQAPPVSSTKGATGHLMGAGALIEIIACIKALNSGILPPTLNLFNADPDCDLDYIPQFARKTSINVAMSNSLGFGGQNSTIIVSKP